MAKMKLGLIIGQQHVDLDELRQVWRHADESGFDRIGCWDHFYESPFKGGTGKTYEATALLSAIAVETKRAQVACFVFGMTYRNPALLAKSLTTIDHLSNGRVLAGIGAGWYVEEHTGYGFDFPDAKGRLDRLSEGARILRGMFDNETSSFDGDVFRTEAVGNMPRPLQPHVPLLIGGGGEKRTLAITARYADEWNIAYASPEVFRAKSEVLDSWCDRVGRDPQTIDRSANVHFYMSSHSKGVDDFLRTASAGNTTPGPQADGAVYGTPREVIERLAQYQDAGASAVQIVIRPPIDHEALQAYIEEVLPAFR